MRVVRRSCAGRSAAPRRNLRTLHNHEFVSDRDFVRAYSRGIKAAGRDYRWRWRPEEEGEVAETRNVIGLFDGYGYVESAFQHRAVAQKVEELGVAIASLRTGHGLLLETPS